MYFPAGVSTSLMGRLVNPKKFFLPQNCFNPDPGSVSLEKIEILLYPRIRPKKNAAIVNPVIKQQVLAAVSTMLF